MEEGGGGLCKHLPQPGAELQRRQCWPKTPDASLRQSERQRPGPVSLSLPPPHPNPPPPSQRRASHHLIALYASSSFLLTALLTPHLALAFVARMRVIWHSLQPCKPHTQTETRWRAARTRQMQEGELSQLNGPRHSYLGKQQLGLQLQSK